jgi:hypothetical protein
MTTIHIFPKMNRDQKAAAWRAADAAGININPQTGTLEFDK